MKDYFFRGKMIGVINHKRQLVCERSYSNLHFLTGGLAFSVGILNDLKKTNINEIIILYKDKGVVKKLVARPNDFIERGYRLLNVNGDTQFSLPLNEFNQYSLSNW